MEKTTVSNNTIQYQYFPKNKQIPKDLYNIVEVFKSNNDSICSFNNQLNSDAVLKIVSDDLTNLGFEIERSKKQKDQIIVPVLFGENGKIEKFFKADGYHKDKKIVIEVEAGRGKTAYQFLKDLFEACMMSEVDYLTIAVRNVYRKNRDFDKVISFFNTLYASQRLILPLKGILIIGY